MTGGAKEANEAILRSRFPGLLELIEKAAREDAPPYALELAEGARGEPTLSAERRWVHSRIDPRKEGERLAAEAEGEGPLVVLGFGLGYAAEAASLAAPERPVVVVERDARVLAFAFSARDLSGFLGLQTLAFVVGGDAAGVGASLYSLKGKPAILANRTLRELSPEWYGEAEKAVRAWASKDEVNAATLRRFGRRWVRNLARNLDAVRTVPGVSSLEGRFKGIPALLVAAGPSLDEVLDRLPAIARRCLVIAVDTSLRAVLSAGVDPDFVVVVDPQYWNARHLDRCPAPRSALVAESAVYPSVMAARFERTFLCASLFPLGRFVEDSVDPKGVLGAGGSVATTAWDFARLLGAAPLWVAGLDLSFPGLKTHFKGALFEERTHAEAKRTGSGELSSFRALLDGMPFPAPSADGKMVLTDKRLALYASWFESRFRVFPESAPRSLSAGGLRIAGMEPDLADSPLALPERREEIDRVKNAVFSETDRSFEAAKPEREASFRKRTAELERGLQDLMRIARRAADCAVEAAGAANPARHLAELDAANDSIARSAVKDAAGFLFPSLESIEAELPPTSDPLARHLAFSRVMYGKLAESARFSFEALRKAKKP